jgi:hypothetical protein
MTYWIPDEILVAGAAPIPGGDRLDASDLAYADDIYPLPKPPAPPPGPPPPVEPEPKPPEPEPPTPPDLDITNLKPGKWSEYREVVPGRSTVFRFKVARKGRFSVLVEGTVKPSVSLLVAPGGRGQVQDADLRNFPPRRDPTGRFDVFRRRCVYRLKAGTYDLHAGGRDEHRDTPGRIRALVATL